jgi:hypothetical protein
VSSRFGRMWSSPSRKAGSHAWYGQAVEITAPRSSTVLSPSRRDRCVALFCRQPLHHHKPGLVKITDKRRVRPAVRLAASVELRFVCFVHGERGHQGRPPRGLAPPIPRRLAVIQRADTSTITSKAALTMPLRTTAHTKSYPHMHGPRRGSPSGPKHRATVTKKYDEINAL